jgi:hypothetical protein
MAFNNILATLQMRDVHGDIYQKEVETDTQVLADAITEIQAFLLVLAQITDLGVASVKYSFRDSTGAFAAQAGSNRDVGATFQGLNTVGDAVVLKIPGIKARLIWQTWTLLRCWRTMRRPVARSASLMETRWIAG